jgi:hypothetical protein
LFDFDLQRKELQYNFWRLGTASSEGMEPVKEFIPRYLVVVVVGRG